MHKLILVRHSAPEIIPDVPANTWRLSEAGRRRCNGLARELRAYEPTRIITSVEPKAVETGQLVAALLDKPCLTGVDLHEHDRSNVSYMTAPQFSTTVARFFDQPAQLVFGRETAEQAYQRFAGGVADIVQQYQDETVAIIAHGTVISLFVARATGVEPLPLWKRLGLPSFVVLSLPGPRVLKIVETVGVA